jgi:ribonuclease HII
VALVIAGIDEAGYGPWLGPLCVGLSVFRIPDWQPGKPAPCMWKLLKAGVCRKPSDARKRIPIADSKALKLSNDNKNNHPLVHLERGVLAFLRALGRDPFSDAELLNSLEARLEERPWYGGEAIPLPLGIRRETLGIACNRVAGALERAGVEVLAMRCLIVSERRVNEVIRRTGSKADATVFAVGDHLRRVWALEHNEGDHLRIVCDQLGGRTAYEEVLARELPGATVSALSESGARSRYSVAGPVRVSHDARDATPAPREAVVQFMPEAESAHLPVAIASMIAKLTRELAMMRFNRYWGSLVPDLKPTAGYYGDARRWLSQAEIVMGPGVRDELVRLA